MNPDPYSDRHLHILTVIVAAVIIMLFGSYWLLTTRDTSAGNRLDSLEGGLSALAVALDELRVAEPQADIPTPEEIIDAAGLDPELLQRPGPEGPIGSQGQPGAQGTDGPIGPQGPQGEPGAQGETGPMGPQGLPGATGEIGPVGPQGQTGPAGATGADGADGATGPAGADGLSPTPEQILEAITAYCADNGGCIGPQGEVGPIGPAGPEGPQGPEGPEGPQGPAGADGTLLTGEQIAERLCSVGFPVMCRV